ncbi:hypothetical protein [Shimazuella soli]|nr:hypothetical protein [Shimazuella soli]
MSTAATKPAKNTIQKGAKLPDSAQAGFVLLYKGTQIQHRKSMLLK